MYGMVRPMVKRSICLTPSVNGTAMNTWSLLDLAPHVAELEIQIVSDLAPALTGRALVEDRLKCGVLAQRVIGLHQFLGERQRDRDLAESHLAVAQVGHDGRVHLEVLGDRVGDAALPLGRPRLPSLGVEFLRFCAEPLSVLLLRRIHRPARLSRGGRYE